jgi:hypothetical protein
MESVEAIGFLGFFRDRFGQHYMDSTTGIATVVLGVKNRTELRECMTAEARGVLDPALMARIDAAVGRD